MTLTSSITLLGSMIVLALIPGPGILVVVGRTLSAGLRQGISTVSGIVVGDFVFITLALLSAPLESGAKTGLLRAYGCLWAAE
jgi:threonine/homoserine/homoserine lactone efflux protein